MDLMLGGTEFSIKGEYINNVIKAFKRAYSNDEDIKVEDISSIEEVFGEFGYNVFKDKDGNITNIDNVSNYLPDGQKKFFESIAAYVVNGSYIILKTGESQTEFVFEKGKVQELKGEFVFHDKNLSYDNVFAILNYLLDYACNSYKIREVIYCLLEGGVTEEELLSLQFDKDDIKAAKEDMENEREESIWK